MMAGGRGGVEDEEAIVFDEEGEEEEITHEEEKELLPQGVEPWEDDDYEVARSISDDGADGEELDQVLKSLVERSILSESQVDEITDSLARGETTARQIIDTWRPRVAEAQSSANGPTGVAESQAPVQPPAAPAPAPASAAGQWPSSLREWVERAFEGCKSDTERSYVEQGLRATIASATASQTLWSKDWESEPLPQQLPPPNLGARVLLTGLQARPELNGEHGEIISSGEDGRFGVRLDSGISVRVRNANLRSIKTGDQSQQPPDRCPLQIDPVQSAVTRGQLSPVQQAQLAALLAFHAITQDQLQELWMSRTFGLLNHADPDIPPCPARLRASNGMHRLHEAAIKGDAMRISRILGRGIDANLLDDCGSTALMHACLWGEDDAVYALLMMGADTELLARSGGGSALCMACVHGPAHQRPQGVPYDASRQLRVVILLLACGANREETTAGGDNPLALAFCAGDHAIIRILQL
uniref:Uncharacterized protein n=1 Tax=Calcidiscus leptoporus TaxID=127549 RepID=A0A7S0IZZ5_9EUKA